MFWFVWWNLVKGGAWLIGMVFKCVFNFCVGVFWWWGVYAKSPLERRLFFPNEQLEHLYEKTEC